MWTPQAAKSHLFVESLSLICRPDPSQDGFGPSCITGNLIAAVSFRRGGKLCDGVLGNAHLTPSGQREETIPFNGMDDGHRIPHLLAGIAFTCEIYLFDGVDVSP